MGIGQGLGLGFELDARLRRAACHVVERRHHRRVRRLEYKGALEEARRLGQVVRARARARARVGVWVWVRGRVKVVASRQTRKEAAAAKMKSARRGKRRGSAERHARQKKRPAAG